MKVNEIITQKFIEALENGVCPWQKPWKAGQRPMNLISGKAYQGINLFLLSHAPYSSPYWLTFKQAKAKGGQVKKGEKSTSVIFWKVSKFEDKKSGEEKTSFLLRYYNVFNLEQCEGIEAPKSEEGEKLDFQPIEAAEDLANDYCERESLKVYHKRPQAYYSPVADYVNMPIKETFVSEGAYYSTLFHEFAHSTGHESRLDRLEPASFGSDPYAKEELVAELSAAFVCAELGIDNTFDNSAAYLQSWIKKLKGDANLLFSASKQATKAFNRIKGEKVTIEA